MTIYAILHYSLKTVTLLFNPVTPYLGEALYQKVYKKLDKKLPDSINFERWPEPDRQMVNKMVEEEFDTLFKAVSLVYAARQQAKLKRRWPLRAAVVVAPVKETVTLKKMESIFLELGNVKTVEYAAKTPKRAVGESWVSAVEGDIAIVVNGQRDEKLLGEGLMRDLARRVQALRKQLGYMPTDVLDGVHIAALDVESSKLVSPYLTEMTELVRTRKVNLHEKTEEVPEAEWHETELDGKTIFISIH
jgi:valyl-tRNA synthetase